MAKINMIRCIVTGAATGSFEHIPAIEVNGKKASFQIDTEITLPDWAVEALDLSSGYDVTRLDGEEPVSPPVVPADGEGDGAVVSPGGASDGTETQQPAPAVEGEPVTGEPATPPAAEPTPPIHPLDHDGNGKKGGSKPRTKKAAAGSE